MRVRTAIDLFGTRTLAEQHARILAAQSVRLRIAELEIDPAALATPTPANTTAPPAVAYVNHGRWVAGCPTEGCNGAIDLIPGVPFLCPNCLNLEIGHAYRLVRWPDDRAELTTALERRLLPEQANWRPPETLADLIAENRARGLT